MTEGQTPAMQSTRRNSADHARFDRTGADSDADLVESPELRALPPLVNQIVDKAIDNMTRKLVAGYRNKKTAQPGAERVDYVLEGKEVLEAVSAESVMQVANRGQVWKEMIQKSLSAGISSISTIKFDGEFQVVDGQPSREFNDMPTTPGVYVVYDDKTGKPVYFGDSDNMRRRWHAGHLNEYREGQRPNREHYKLADEFEGGCTVKFIKMETKESAAALEAHLIRENFDQFPSIKTNPKGLKPEEMIARNDALEKGLAKNKRHELKDEQGVVSNKEAKKVKDASGSTTSLAKGAAVEGAKNVGYDVFERLATAVIKAVKDELVDIVRGGKAKIAARLQRFFAKILTVLKGLLDNALQLLRGLVEFIVNALSKAISQVYNLARNLFDIANGAWNLYRGASTMSREELVRKVSETVIISGSLAVWDALDPVIESNLGVLGPFAPYISCAVVAIGFGLSSYALQAIVAKIIDAIVAFKQGFSDSLEAARASCDQLIRIAERELAMMTDLRDYVASSLEVMGQMRTHTASLSQHEPIQRLDIRGLLPNRL